MLRVAIFIETEKPDQCPAFAVAGAGFEPTTWRTPELTLLNI